MTRKRNTTTVDTVDITADQVEEVTVSEEVTFSAKDLAAELDIDAKTFRRWLRAHTEDRANKGGRWLFTAEAKAQLLDAYRAPVADADAEAQVTDEE